MHDALVNSAQEVSENNYQEYDEDRTSPAFIRNMQRIKNLLSNL